ncbi:hypothetical protein C9374_009068 [Naegleria lovaniensis]|uniref:BUB1 N-terminal domain-containing protein n=1 Tax=Naegleria lovaniensis TaxID=51637 RepID=A0AA88GHN3_NAELO|nr:uncharacterized protein C9374_009068 [Naegleria lovaniensis]KAG2377552.1 hypothetical protein C9374_009068 [Naegleria lovaniensis]
MLSLGSSDSNEEQAHLTFPSHHHHEELTGPTEQQRVIVDFEEFESSKENILPLKSGRRAVDLRRVFGTLNRSSSSPSLRGVLKERKDFMTGTSSSSSSSSGSSSEMMMMMNSSNLSSRMNHSPIFMMNSLLNSFPTTCSITSSSSSNMMMMTDDSQILPNTCNPIDEEEGEDVQEDATAIPETFSSLTQNSSSSTSSSNNNNFTNSSPITTTNHTTNTTHSNNNNNPGNRPFFCFNHLIRKVCYENHNMKPKLNQERKHYEKRISSTALANHLDPLSVWLEYIEWIEKNYPTLNKSSQYVPTLQACTKYVLLSSQQQHQDPSSSSSSSLLERYREDERYLQVWLKYADQCLDPIDVFTFLETKKIGLSHSELYIRWATVLEDRKDLKAADAVLEKGKHRGAQPMKALETFHTGVKARFMKSILNRGGLSTTTATTTSTSTTTGQVTASTNQNAQGNAVNVNNNENGGIGQRAPFHPLSKKPSSIRPTTAKPPTMMKPMKMKMNNPSLAQKNSPLNNFVVYDESVNHAEKLAHAATTRTLPFQIQRDHCNSAVPSQVLPRTLPSEQEAEKENNERPDKWTNYSNPQFVTQDVDDLTTFMLTPPPQVSNAVSKPACHFSIFVDEEFK